MKNRKFKFRWADVCCIDDGVKVNYGKLGDLLAEVKAVHGKKAEKA